MATSAGKTLEDKTSDEWKINEGVLEQVAKDQGIDQPEVFARDSKVQSAIKEMINDEGFPDFYDAMSARRDFRADNSDIDKTFPTSDSIFDGLNSDNLANPKFVELLQIEHRIIEAKFKLIHKQDASTSMKLSIIQLFGLAEAYTRAAKIIF